MNQIKLDTLEKDQRFEGFLLVRNAQKRVNKNGDPYLDFTLADNSREINAKQWNSTQEAPEAGQVIKVRSTITEYNGRLQMRVDRFREALEEDQVDLSELVASAPRDADEMFRELLSVVDGMQNPVLKAITAELVKRAGDKILYYPAAQSMHHAQRSGLLLHLTDMLRAAKAICACYPYLEEDLVVAGVIVHDLGKLNEMLANTLGAVSEYSREGLLLGHITTGVSDLRQAARDLGYREDDEYPLLLSHMILSHHGIAEYGSARPPMFPEAEVLHWLDVLDARLNSMRGALLVTKQGGFSERVFALDRRVYHPRYLHEPVLDDEDASDEDSELSPARDNGATLLSKRREQAENSYNNFL